jgi:colanic acid/amylovoran biosynthesis glycosyltransferase
MEAMAMEIACVTTNVAGIPELIRDGFDGLLVPPSDVDALVRAMARLMDDPELRQHIASNGRTRVVEQFELRRNVERLAQTFSERIRRDC